MGDRLWSYLEVISYMPEQDSGAGEIEHRDEVLDVMLPARDHAS